ncbi:MAG: atpF [Candidatus Saccharibacteria bacterium]|nr:atpF [Candidatus Saccharibacteria bacterium]
MITSFTQFAAEGASSGGIGALGVDAKAFVIQLVTFVLAFLVLRKWAFKPILAVLQQRRETIETGVKLGEQMKKEKAELETQVAKQLQDARAKADGVMADAESAARDTVRAAEEKAEAKAAVIVKEGKARGEQEVVRARKELESELVGLISDATETIIGEKVDAKKDSALIDRALKAGRA